MAAVPQCEVSVQPPSGKKIAAAAAAADTNGGMEVSHALYTLYMYKVCLSIS